MSAPGSVLPRLEVANAHFVTPRLVVGGDLDQRDDLLAAAQLGELVEHGLTHLVDARVEADDRDFVAGLAPDVTYHWHGMDDAGQRVPGSWFERGVGFVLDAWRADPAAVVLVHCHMGINRGPSLGYAVLLALGWDLVEAIHAIRAVRPIAHVAYAEDALRWHHDRVGAGSGQRRCDRDRLASWRRQHPLDVVRVIAEERRRGA